MILQGSWWDNTNQQTHKHNICQTDLPLLNSAHRSGLKACTDEQQDLRHQDGEGQVGVDVVSLVTDGADGAEERRETRTYHQHRQMKCDGVKILTTRQQR